MEPKLFMMLLGATPEGKVTEQHDTRFGIAPDLKELKPYIIESWPEANGKIHIDVWREVTCVEGRLIKVVPKDSPKDPNEVDEKLFFLNLGGYKEGEFEEYHYKMLALGKDLGEAVKKGKETAFYKHTGYKGAEAHVDNKYGVDVDDMYEIADILPPSMKEHYRVVVTSLEAQPDIEHAGYLKIDKII